MGPWNKKWWVGEECSLSHLKSWAKLKKACTFRCFCLWDTVLTDIQICFTVTNIKMLQKNWWCDHFNTDADQTPTCALTIRNSQNLLLNSRNPSDRDCPSKAPIPAINRVVFQTCVSTMLHQNQPQIKSEAGGVPSFNKTPMTERKRQSDPNC